MIERELTVSVGDTIQREALDRTRNRLLNLGLFNRVEVVADSHGVVTVRLAEAWHLWPIVSVNLDETQLSLLFESPQRFFDGASFDIGALDMNLLGSGAIVQALARVGASRGGTLSYHTRWFSRSIPLSVRAHFRNLTIVNRHAAILGLDRESQDVRGELQIGTREGMPARAGMKFRYEYVKEEPLWPEAAAPKDRTGLVGIFMALEHRDVEWYPSKGSYVWLEANYIGGDRHFFRSEADGRAFWPLTEGTRPMVLALRFRGGTASAGMTPWARWFFGFNTGFRGYRTEKSEADGYLSGTAELRFPLTSIVYFDVPLGSRFQNLPFGLNGVVFVERTELRLGRRRAELLAGGVGLGCRVPYIHIMEVDFSLTAEGEREVSASIGMAL